MTRIRPLLAAAALVVGACTGVLAASPRSALAKGGTPLDVYNLQGDGAPMVVSVKTGYSFVVYPQVHVPRANAFIEAGQATAVASPADPGDGTDSLPGLLVPQGESQGPAGIKGGGNCAPPPFSTVFSTAGDAAATFVNAVSPYNPVLTTPYEHVQVVYPNPQHAGPQQATFGADPSVAIPGGQMAVDAAAGKVFADNGVGLADSGAGTAVSIPAIGLSTGRVSSHVEVHNLGGMVTSDVVSTVSNVTFNPPQVQIPSSTVPIAGGPLATVPTALAVPNGPILHIGSIVTTVHTERIGGAPAATGSHSVVFGGVTVLGQAATIDDSGIHLAGSPQGPSIQSVVSQLNALFAGAGAVNGAVPSSTPVVGGQAIIPQGTMTGPLTTDSLTHNKNEDHVTVSGLTLSVKGSLLEPTQTEGITGSGCGGPSAPSFVAAPATYTITLATADSSAYGYSFPASSTGLGVSPLSASSLGSGLSAAGGSIGGDTGLTSGAPSVSSGGGGAAGGGTGGPPRTSTGTARRAGVSIDPALLSKGGLITLALFAEMLLLGALLGSYRMRSAPAAARRPGAETNLI